MPQPSYPTADHPQTLGPHRYAARESITIPRSPQVSLRGGLLIFIADSPRRALVLCEKHPNAFSLHPCPYCMVKQVEDEPKGGGLGDAQFDIDKNRRTLGQMKDGWRRLDALPNNSNEQRELSKDLGLVVDSANRGRPLVDKMLLNTILHVPVERLHADAIVSCAYPELRASAGFFKGTHYYATMPSPPFLSCTCCGVVLAGEAILIFARGDK